MRIVVAAFVSLAIFAAAAGSSSAFDLKTHLNQQNDGRD